MGARGGAARAAAALAVGALAWGAPPRAPEPAACAAPRRLAGDEGLARIACAGAAGRPLEGAERLLFGGRLDPNHASPRALDALPGIGPARAAAIVREARVRAFCRPEDLDRVPGIGPRRLAQLAEWVEVGPGACRP